MTTRDKHFWEYVVLTVFFLVYLGMGLWCAKAMGMIDREIQNMNNSNSDDCY